MLRAGARVDSLTGIRSLAALAVCFTHAAYWTGRYTPDLPGQFFARFEIGVALFFVLSGYLLFRPWVAVVFDRRPMPSVRRYSWHRARRILPAYWITVIAVFAIYRWWITDDSVFGHGWSGFVRNMTLTQVYGLGHLHSGLTQMWSLAAEVVYYVALPPVAWLVVVVVCRRRPRPIAALVALGVFALISPLWAVIVANTDGIDPTARLWAPAFATWFIGGMMLAVAARVVTRWHALLSVLVGVLAFQISWTSLAGEPTITPTGVGATIVKLLLYLVAAVALIAPLVLGERGNWWDRLLSWRPLVAIGEISYEFFCVHVMVLELMMRALGFHVFSGSTGLVFVATTVVSLAVAWVLHRLTRPIWSPGHRRRINAPGSAFVGHTG